MASISFSGLGSGIDIAGIVKSLVDAERVPATARLDLAESDAQAKLSALGNLKGALSALQSSITSLSRISGFSNRSVSLSTADFISASATSSALTGNYDVNVNTLAQAHTLASDVNTPFSSLTDSIGTGTLTFQLGTFSGGVFTADPDKVSQDVTISTNDNSLQGIRDAINNADVGVTASIVNDGNGYRLLIASNDTGAANSLKITVSGDSGGTDTDTTGLSQLAYDPEAASGSGKNLTQTVAAGDANFDINGLTISSSTNTVTNAIDGLTLNLKAVSTAATTVRVSNDTGGVTAKINTFVQNYNAFISLVNAATAYNPDTNVAGVLIGDSSVRGVESGIRSLIGSAFGSDSINTLSQIGITTGDDGTLSVDSGVLSDALSNNFDTVTGIFSALGAASDSLINVSGFNDSTQEGNYDVVVNSLATQGTFQGLTGITSATLTTSNNTFTLDINGTSSNTITLTEGVYDDDTKLATLANDIQTQINNDTNFSDLGITASVSYDATNDRFVITSSQYGSNSTVDITTDNADLGLTSSGTSTGGTDVSGTIGGQTATGSGQLLTGTGDATGLILEITGGNTGSRGAINFQRGFADKLDTLIDNYLSTGGFIESRSNGLQSRIDDITSQREALSQRLSALQTRLNAQYTALDSLVAQLNSTSQFLTQQLGSLPQIGRTNNRSGN